MGDFSIDRNSAYELAQKALVESRDALGYRDYDGPQGEDATSEDETDFMVELANDALTGRQPGVLEKLMRWPALGRMDPVTEALLLGMGLVPGALLTISEVLGPNSFIRIVDDQDSEIVHVESHPSATGVTEWVVRLAPGADGPAWRSIGEISMTPIPDTIVTAACGQRLSRIISHPVLDRMPIVIGEGSATESGLTSIDVRGCVDASTLRSRDDMMRDYRRAPPGVA